MANKAFAAIGLSGGSSGFLDSIKTATISDQDICFVIVNSGEEFYVYTFDSGNVAAESSPDVIYPDDAAGTEAWLICDITMGIGTIRETLAVTGTSEFTGNVNFAGNADIDGTLTFDGAGPAIDEVLDEDNMASNSATKLATQQSIKAYVDTSVAGITTDVDLLAGFVNRPQFTYSDTDTITISSGRYHLLGTAQGENIYKWDSAITFDFGSGGSNANSDDLTASAWHYLYVDDSSLTDSTTALVAANFLNDTTAPTWDASECGWYNGADRCIGAFITNGSSQIVEFFHDGGDYILFADAVTDLSNTDIDTTWTDVTLTLPTFSTRAEITTETRATTNAVSIIYYWRTNGTVTASTGHYMSDSYSSNNSSGRVSNSATVITDSSQIVEVKHSASGTQTMSLRTNGFYLPRGM